MKTEKERDDAVGAAPPSHMDIFISESLQQNARKAFNLLSTTTTRFQTALAASPPPDSNTSCLAFPLPIPPNPTPIRLATYLCATRPPQAQAPPPTTPRPTLSGPRRPC